MENLFLVFQAFHGPSFPQLGPQRPERFNGLKFRYRPAHRYETVLTVASVDYVTVTMYHNYETVDPTFFKVNPASGVPIYLQLMERFRHAVESCLLAPGDQLPAIRTLAQQLVISPNTVVKVYTELDREGIIELRHGVGAFVLDAERHRDRGKEIRVAKNLVRGLVERLRNKASPLTKFAVLSKPKSI